jgi:hypothetical protein
MTSFQFIRSDDDVHACRESGFFDLFFFLIYHAFLSDDDEYSELDSLTFMSFPSVSTALRFPELFLLQKAVHFHTQLFKPFQQRFFSDGGFFGPQRRRNQIEEAFNHVMDRQICDSFPPDFFDTGRNPDLLYPLPSEAL